MLLSISNEALALQVRQGDVLALETLWRQTEGLALWVMKRYKLTPSVDEGDLLQAAYFALLKAVNEFDAMRGSFSTLYVWRLRSAYADALGMTRRHVEEVASLDATISEDGEATMRDMLIDENAVDPEEHAIKNTVRAALLEAIRQLPDRWRLIILARYFNDFTLEQCAKLLQITPARAQRIERDALYRLRHNRALLQSLWNQTDDES